MIAFFQGLLDELASNPPAHIVGGIAILFVILTYQFDESKKIVLCQVFASGIFAIHFWLLGGYSGMIINIFASLSCVIFYFRTDKKWADTVLWPIFFVALSWVVNALTSYKTDGWWMLLPMASFAFSRTSLFSKVPRITRFFSIPASILFQVYNIHTMSYAGILAETFSITSVLVGVIRFDILKREEKKRV